MWVGPHSILVCGERGRRDYLLVGSLRTLTNTAIRTIIHTYFSELNNLLFHGNAVLSSLQPYILMHLPYSSDPSRSLLYLLTYFFLFSLTHLIKYSLSWKLDFFVLTWKCPWESLAPHDWVVCFSYMGPLVLRAHLILALTIWHSSLPFTSPLSCKF